MPSAETSFSGVYTSSLSVTQRALRVVALAYVFVVGFPANYGPIEPGLDGSWQYALNYLAGSSYVFGRDVNFTYGPLGYLIVPEPVGSNLIVATVVALSLYGLFIGLTALQFWRAKGQAIGLFVLSFVVAEVCGLYFESSLLLLIAMLVLVPRTNTRVLTPPVALALGAALSGAFLLVKISLSVEAFSMIVLGAMCSAWPSSRAILRNLGLAAVAYSLTAVAFAFAYFHSVPNFIEWMSVSADILRGYDLAMAIDGSPVVLGSGVMLLGGFLALALGSLRWDRGYVQGAVVLAPAAISNFKHAFVRQDSHILVFFPLLLAMCGVAVLVSRTRTVLRFAGALVIVGVVLNVATVASLADRPALSILSGASGLASIGALVSGPSLGDRLLAESDAALAAKRLPPDWLDLIAATHGRVDAIPWELSYTRANNLPWVPNPSLQTYVAYTSGLDERVAAHFAGPGRPDFVIVDFQGIDGRNPITDTPATWRALLQYYRVQAHSPGAGSILLRTREEPILIEQTVLGSQPLTLGEEVTVPSSTGLVSADVNLQLNVRGLVRRALVRVSPVYARLHYASGRTLDVRLVPETVPDGVLLSPLPANADELVDLLNGTPRDRVERVGVVGPGLDSYAARTTITWTQALLP